MQAAGELGPGDLAEIVPEGPVTDPDVSAPACEGDFLVVHNGDGGPLHDFSLRERDFLALVEILHRGGGGGERGNGQQGHEREAPDSGFW